MERQRRSAARPKPCLWAVCCSGGRVLVRCQRLGMLHLMCASRERWCLSQDAWQHIGFHMWMVDSPLQMAPLTCQCLARALAGVLSLVRERLQACGLLNCQGSGG